MSISSIKKILLAGTALVASTFISEQANATTVTLGAAGTWGSTGAPGLYTGADVAHAAAGQDFALAGFVGTVKNDQTAQDSAGDGLNVFTIGAVSTNTALGALNIATGSANNLTVNITSLTNGTTTAATNINNTAFNANSVLVNFSGAFSSSGNLLLTDSAATAQTVALNVNGNYTSAGTSVITAGTLTGADATLTLNGASNSINALTLTETAGGGQGHSTLVLGGSNASQTFAGTIAGNAAHEGVLTVNSTGAATGLTGAISNLRAINAGATGNTTTFNSAVTTTDALNVTGTGTVVLTTTSGITATNFAGGNGTLTVGTGATLTSTLTTSTVDTGTLNLAGTSVLTGTAGASGTELFAVTGGLENTTSSISAATYAKTVTIAGTTDAAHAGATNFGAVLAVGAGGMTVSSAGATNAQAESSTVTGLFTDAGTLHVTAAATAASNATLTLNGAGSNVITGAATLTDGTAGLATLSVGDTANVTFTGGLAGNAAGKGTLTLAGSSTITGTVGSTSLLAVNAGVTGKTDVFNGNVSAATLAFGGGTGTVQIGSGYNLTTTNITGAAAGTLTLVGGTQTVAGTINDASMIINAGATSAATTFSGNVTAATIHATGTGAGGTIALNGATTTANLLFDATSTDTVTVASGSTLAGNVNGTGGTLGAGIGTLKLAGTNTVTGQIGNTGYLNTLTLLGSGVTDTVTSAATAVNAATHTNLANNTLAVGTQVFTLGAGQTLSSTYDGTHYGKVTSTGASVVSTTAMVNLTIAPNVYLPTTTFTLASGTGAGIGTLAAGKLTVNGITDTTQTLTEGVMTYTQVADTANLKILATRAAAASVGSTTNNTAVGAALDTIAAGGGSVIQQIQGNLAAQTTAAGVNNILGSLIPTVDGGSQASALEVTSEVEDITDTRMAALRANDGSTGVAAGATANGVSMWAQGYGQGASQDTRDSVAGYSDTTWGGAVGVDSTQLVNDGVLGFAVNYGKSTVDSKNLNTTNTDVDNYGATLYGTLGLGQRMFVDGQVGYGYNTINSTRHDVNGPGTGVSAYGTTHSDQYDAKVSLGRDYPVDYGTVLTPDVSASYTYLNTSGYTETGTGANLTVGSNSQSALDLGVGVKAAWKLKNEDGSLMKPVVHVGYAYDAIGDKIDTTANFVGSPSAAFVTSGPSPERNKFNAGAGVTYMTTANWDMSANYNFQYRSDYQSHTGTLRLTSHF